MAASTPVRVLHVTFDMRIGGTEQVIRNLIAASEPTVLDMSIYCIEEPIGPWGKALCADGVSIHSCNRQPGFDTRVVRALRNHIRRERIDILHCHQYTPWVYGAIAAFGTPARIIFTEHGRFYPDRARPKRRFVNPLLAHFTDRITAISDATKRALVDYEYLQEHRIEVVYNGITGLTPQPAAAAALRAQLGISDDAPVLGTVARFDPIKNHRMMLEAFRRVIEDHPDARLLLVGDGDERGNIERWIGELELGDRVVLPGYLPDPAVWLNAMDIFLLSSLSEGTSMTLLEALSLGKCCVVTNVGGNPEIIDDGVNGYLTPSGEPEAFAAAIGRALSTCRDSAHAATIVAGWRRRFSSQVMAAAFASYYLELTGRRITAATNGGT